MLSEKALQAKRDELIALAESKQSYLAREWLLAIQAVKDIATLDTLIVAVANNDTYAMQRMFSAESVQLKLTGFKNAMADVYGTAGKAIASQSEAGVYFNQLNPRLVEIVNNWSNTLITNETQATIQGVGEELGKATIQGKNPIVGARAIRNSIGLTPQQVKAIENYERNLRQGQSVSNYRLRDKRLDTKRALKEDEILKRVERYTQKQLKFRAETIARTESLRMVNMANQHIYENGIEEGTIGVNDYRKFWVATRDKRTRDAHRTLPSMNKEGRAIREPFQSTLGLIQYPHDPNASAKNTIRCRCVVIYDLQAEAFL